MAKVNIIKIPKYKPSTGPNIVTLYRDILVKLALNINGLRIDLSLVAISRFAYT